MVAMNVKFLLIYFVTIFYQLRILKYFVNID